MRRRTRTQRARGRRDLVILTVPARLARDRQYLGALRADLGELRRQTGVHFLVVPDNCSATIARSRR